MRLLTNSRYGTRMMVDIAAHYENGPVQMSDIARRQNISQKYLEKIIRDLKKAGFVKSVRGPKGGHLPAMSPAEMTVGMIVRILEGDTSLVDCERDEDLCSNAPGCMTRLIWKEGSKAMFDKFDSITIAELAEFAKQGVKFGDYCEAHNRNERAGRVDEPRRKETAPAQGGLSADDGLPAMGIA